MRAVSFREHVDMKGSIYADLLSMIAGQHWCLRFLFLVSGIISCLIVGVI